MSASVEQPSLNFLLNTTALASDLPYPTANSYTQEAPNGYTMHVQPSGSATSLINLPIFLQEGSDYTFIAAEAAFASPTLAPILLTDDNAPPASGKAKLRMVNASPDVGSLDVYAVAPGANINNATPTFSNIGFEAASAYESLAAGRYQIYFTSAGQKTILFQSGVLVLADGQIRTVVALDNTGGYTVSVLSDLN